jgi:hypothetical protein
MDTTTTTTTTISTAHPYRPARLTVSRVIKVMRTGATLHCGLAPVGWWLSNGWEVGEQVAEKVVCRIDVAGVGDCLFGTEYSQTFRYIEG